jgi:hypothetical protein
MTAGVEEWPWQLGGVEERPWREGGRREATTALAVAARALAHAGRSGDDGCWRRLARKQSSLGMVTIFSSVRNVHGLLLDHKTDCKF